jgi:hypothetical protein
MATSLLYNGFDLQTANILTDDIDHQSIPNKNANTYALAHANKSALPFINYPSKQITLKGTIKGSSIADTDSRVDSFKAYFNGKDGNLDIGYNGGTRRYIGTATAVDVNRPKGLAYAEFTVIITCTIPFGMATSATTGINDTGNTTATDSFNVTFAGNAPIQLPVIEITLTAVTGGANHLQVTNNANGQGMVLLGQTFANGDVIVIDSSTRKVTRNGTEIDYLGSFIEVGPGLVQFNYADGFTTRTFSFKVTYTPLYM